MTVKPFIPDQEDITRVVELMNVANRTEEVPNEVACFIAARILRKEGLDVKVCSQTIALRDHMDRQPVSNEVYLAVGNFLIDGFGVYKNASEMALDRKKRWSVPHAQAFGHPKAYPQAVEKEDEEIYTGWGYTSQDTYHMIDKLEIEDCADRIHRGTPSAGSPSSKIRL